MHKNLFFYPTIIFLVLVFSFSANAQNNARKCKIKSFVGEVKMRRGNSPKWVKARPNAPLKENDAIRTFVESEVVLLISDGTQITLEENTTLELAKLKSSRDGANKTGMKILSGDLMANVKKLVNKKSSFEFETPTAVASIRGTRVGFNVDKAKTNIKVYEGKVYVVPKGSRKGAELKTNQMTTVVKGQKKVVVRTFTEKPNKDQKTGSTPTDSTQTNVDTLSVIKDSLIDTTIADSTQIPIQDSLITKDSIANSDLNPDIDTTYKANLEDSIEVIDTIDDASVEDTIIPLDTLEEDKSDFDEDTTADIDTVPVIQEHFVLRVFSPEDNKTVFTQTQIVVTGRVMPSSAQVSINGSVVPISAQGDFRKTIQAPSEPGQYEISIEASFQEVNKSMVRQYTVKPQPQELQLIINEPINNLSIDKPFIRVSGFVTPGAEIMVSGMSISVSSTGSFSQEIPLADEEGEVYLEFEALLHDQSKTVTRTVIYKRPLEGLSISVQEPVDKQLVCQRNVPVRGMIRPTNITAITVNGSEIIVRNGSFSDYVTISEEKGEHEIEFEVMDENRTKTMSRIINYDPAGSQCNTQAPTIQPSNLPFSTKKSGLIFTVYDLTPFDEITFYYSVDGYKDSEIGVPGGQFYLSLEEGVHQYEIYAEDLNGNRTAKVTGSVSYLPNDLIISIAEPSSEHHIIHVPPSAPPNIKFNPEFTIEFSVENLANDDPKLLQAVSVRNETNMASKSLKNFTSDINFALDIRLTRGINRIVIEVVDIIDRQYSKTITIEVR